MKIVTLVDETPFTPTPSGIAHTPVHGIQQIGSEPCLDPMMLEPEIDDGIAIVILRRRNLEVIDTERFPVRLNYLPNSLCD